MVKEAKVLRPRIRISGISKDVGEDNVMFYVTRQNEFVFGDDSKCKLLKLSPVRNNLDISQALIEVDYPTDKRALSIGHCLVGLNSCNIYDAIDISRCYKCNGFHHTFRNCKSKEPSFPRCAGSHVVKDCNADILKCVNCLSLKEKSKADNIVVEHAAWDYNLCTAYKQAVDKIKIDVFGRVF